MENLPMVLTVLSDFNQNFCFTVSRGVGSNFHHSFTVINFFAAIWTMIKTNLGNGISPTFIFTMYIPHNSFYFVAAAGWTSFDMQFSAHSHIAFFEEIKK